MLDTNIPWWLMAWGFAGQAMFTMRFVVQWFATEKAKKSVIPIAFWYFSLAGSFMLLSYAVLRADPPIILGQMFGFIVYIRNLYYIKKGKKVKTGGLIAKPKPDFSQKFVIKTKINRSGDFHGRRTNSARYILQQNKPRKTKSSASH